MLSSKPFSLRDMLSFEPFSLFLKAHVELPERSLARLAAACASILVIEFVAFRGTFFTDVIESVAMHAFELAFFPVSVYFVSTRDTLPLEEVPSTSQSR